MNPLPRQEEIDNPYTVLSYLFLPPSEKEQQKTRLSIDEAHYLGQRALESMSLPETASTFWAEDAIKELFRTFYTRSPHRRMKHCNDFALAGTLYIAQAIAYSAYVRGDDITRDAIVHVLEKRQSETMNAVAYDIMHITSVFDTLPIQEDLTLVEPPTEALQTS